MTENFKYPKIVTRANINQADVKIGGLTGQVEYTSGWEAVEGGKGVTCRTWKVAGSGNTTIADGADIHMDEKGYTPLQLVDAARVVVDTPEMDCDVYCCYLAPGNVKPKVIHFTGQKKGQMVWAKDTFICWIAKKESRLTEFESPAFNNKMFANVPEGVNEFRGRNITKLLATIKNLREKVKV